MVSVFDTVEWVYFYANSDDNREVQWQKNRTEERKNSLSQIHKYNYIQPI